MTNFSVDVDELEQLFSAQHQARESMLSICRKVIQQCSTSIRSTHRGEFEKAKQINTESEQMLDQCASELSDFPEISANSLFYDAQKEYAESCVTLALIQGHEIPTRDELKVTPAAYINGVVEAASELRRFVLDVLRKKDVARAEELLEVMDSVYGIAISIDYPDALTHGLRRTTDAFRAVLERTRSDVTTASIFLSVNPQ